MANTVKFVAPLSANRQILESNILIDADISGKTKYTLCNDVFQDFVGPPGNPQSRFP